MGSSSSRKKFIATTQREAGDVLGVGARQVADYISRGCPGRAKNYPIREMIAWCKANIWCARPSESTEPADAKKPTTDDLLKEEKLQLARLQRLEKQGELLTRENVHAGLGLLAETLNQGLVQIAREHPDAAEILRETLDALEREYVERFDFAGS